MVNRDGGGRAVIVLAAAALLAAGCSSGGDGARGGSDAASRRVPAAAQGERARTQVAGAASHGDTAVASGDGGTVVGARRVGVTRRVGAGRIGAVGQAGVAGTVTNGAVNGLAGSRTDPTAGDRSDDGIALLPPAHPDSGDGSAGQGDILGDSGIPGSASPSFRGDSDAATGLSEDIPGAVTPGGPPTDDSGAATGDRTVPLADAPATTPPAAAAPVTDGAIPPGQSDLVPAGPAAEVPIPADK
jgi:hypothetical protein